MWIIQSRYGRPDFYDSLERELLALIHGEPNRIANLANVASWLFHTLPSLNWAGFYLWSKEDGELVLGPFQGKPACLRIRPERGVCGKAFISKTTQRVDDVHTFPGHISCDSASRSELVIPLFMGEEVWAVLDLDSPRTANFTEEDAANLTAIFQRLKL
jgi:L-methionine (R)-S-oxide reductase